jgi:hypothetical protein
MNYKNQWFSSVSDLENIVKWSPEVKEAEIAMFPEIHSN